MRLSGRVKSLERRTGVGGPCPACGGRGSCGSAIRINGVELKRHGGCTRCGRFSTIKTIVLNYDTEHEAEEAREMWR